MRPAQQQQYVYLPPPALPHLQLPAGYGSHCGPHLQHHVAGPGVAAPGIPAMGVPLGGGQYEYLPQGMLQGGEPGHPGWMNLRAESRSWEAGVFAAQGRPDPNFNRGMSIRHDLVPASLSGHGLHQVYAHPFQQQQQQHQPQQMIQGMGILPAPHAALPSGPDAARWGHRPPRPGWYGGMHSPQELYQAQVHGPEFGAGNMDPAAGGGGRKSAPHAGNRSKDGNGAYKAPSSSSPRPPQVGGSAEHLYCATCDRSFNSSQQKVAHTSTHVKCDAQGCTFEASTRVVREHKQSAHGKKEGASGVPSRAAWMLSKDVEGEDRRWQEERKKNYPTASNIKRKEEELAARRARGELVDEDARKRGQWLKEILARQAQLGCPVAEMPEYYLRDSYGLLDGRGQGRKSAGKTLKKRQKDPEVEAASYSDKNVGEKRCRDERERDPSEGSSINEERAPKSARLEKVSRASELIEDDTPTVLGGMGASSEVETDESENPVQTRRQKKQGMRPCYFFMRGRCKKGGKCEFLHERGSGGGGGGGGKHTPGGGRGSKGQEAGQNANQRKSSLLAKLLHPEIQRDKSHILQSLRFFVNNSFLLDYPRQPLEYFSWLATEDLHSDGDVQPSSVPSNDLQPSHAQQSDVQQDGDAQPSHIQHPPPFHMESTDTPSHSDCLPPDGHQAVDVQLTDVS